MSKSQHADSATDTVRGDGNVDLLVSSIAGSSGRRRREGEGGIQRMVRTTLTAGIDFRLGGVAGVELYKVQAARYRQT